ncbi:MAG: lipopolysaccharide biosynthesis protein [Dongiaceae bacterium]
MASGRTTAARSIWWTLLESCGLSGLSFATVVVLARFLAPADFGVAAMALGFVQIFAALAVSLFHDAIIQRQELRPAHLDSAFWAATLIGALLSLACWLGGGWIAGVLGEPAVAPVLRWMSLSLLFCGVDGVVVAELRRGMQFKALAARSLFGRVAGAAIGIAGAAAGFGVWALVAQQITTSVLSSAVVLIRAPRRPRLALSPRAVAELASFAFGSLLSQLLGFSNIRVFIILCGYLLGATAVGYLNLAFRMVDTVKDALAAAANQLALPLFSRRQGDRQALLRAYQEASEFACLATLPIFAGLVACPEEIVAFVFGSRWLPAAPLVQILGAVAVIYFVRLFNGTVLTAVGRPQLNAAANAVGCIVTLGGLLVFGRYGVVAAAAAWALRVLFTVPLGIAFQRWTTGMGLAEQMRRTAAPLAAAMLMAALVWVVRVELLEAWPLKQRLLVLVPLGAVSYAAVLFALSPRAVPRLLVFLGEGLRRRKPAATAGA